MTQWTQETVRIAGTDLMLVKGGAGRPLLILHEELGHPGWLDWHAELARTHTVLIPLHPGFGKSPPVEWIWNIRDLACFYSRLIREQRLTPLDVIGFSLGGWIAAEMAVNDAKQFRRLVLVAPTGIKPPQGDIMDLFTVTARAYLNASVYDVANTPQFAKLYGGEQTPEQFEAWEDARAQTSRLAWQPYMYYPSLGNLLEGIAPPPTLLVWGKQDQVVPLSAGEVYHKSVTGSELVVFERCGHRPEVEQPAEFTEHVQRFLA